MLLLSLQTVSCGEVEPAPRPLGELALPLVLSDDDDGYRLRGTFAVFADRLDAGSALRRLRTDAEPDASSLRVALPAGPYAVMLEPGWSLLRRADGGFAPVAAELRGDNPAFVTIAGGARSALSFRFAVEGRELATEGTLGIGIDVDETGAVCGNGVRELGEACDLGEVNGSAGCDHGCLYACQGQCPVRVDPAAAAEGDGSSWDKPVRDLQALLDRTVPAPDEVWVRGDVMPPVTLRQAVVLRGGFAGTERTPDERRASTPRTLIPSLTVSAATPVRVERVQIQSPPENPWASESRVSPSRSGPLPHSWRRPGRGPTGFMSNAGLRAKLWMPTLRAVTKNLWLKTFYDRLVAAGKPKKLAMVAAMRKLLGAMMSVAKNRKAFVPKLADAMSAN